MKEEQKTIFPRPFYFLLFHAHLERGKPHINIVKNLFSSDPSSFKYYLEHDNGIRYAGWDLSIRKPYDINLYGIQAENRSKRICVKNNGGLLIEGALIPGFLCWGDESSESIRHLAIIEFTYNAVLALKRMLSDIEGVTHVEYLGGFVGDDESKIYLPLGGAYASSIIREKRYLKQDSKEFSGTFSSNQLGKSEDELAFILIENVYRMYGFSVEEIPFTKKNETGITVIDVEKIIKA